MADDAMRGASESSPGKGSTSVASAASSTGSVSSAPARPAPPLTAAQLGAQADSEVAGASTAPGTASSEDAAGTSGGPATSSKEKRAAAPSKLATGGRAVKAGVDALRNRIASLVWLVAVLAAVVLAIGALIYALDANRSNDIVKGVLQVAHKIDGPF